MKRKRKSEKKVQMALLDLLVYFAHAHSILDFTDIKGADRELRYWIYCGFALERSSSSLTTAAVSVAVFTNRPSLTDGPVKPCPQEDSSRHHSHHRSEHAIRLRLGNAQSQHGRANGPSRRKQQLSRVLKSH